MDREQELKIEDRWIKELRKQRDRLMKETGGDVWAELDLKICLGDANRLLYILDLVRGLEDPDPVPANENRSTFEIAGEEAYLLATGAMEG